MSKFYFVFVAAMMLSAPAIYADPQDMSSDSKPCAMIAKACKQAGFGRHSETNKKFWKDCMKPVILGQSVKDVKVDADIAKSCRTDKINRLQQELNEFQNSN
ncbi:MAG: hypothetical protein H0W64_11200 [Gammaproteobacteria bacterium]|nr:hypothetical protein [Gammaproteobacteria bacterium]